jgi:poly-gamma-glutamate capsule biosynthesis protein CapA/YwtB (metallophosphatase superfamily)
MARLPRDWTLEPPPTPVAMNKARQITLFLCGDVMTGRGIDQVLPHSCSPHLYEPVVTSALDYVALAEEANGPIPRRVAPSYIWGDALGALDRVRPDARIINLETSVTTCEDAAPKGINYRMHPGNVTVITTAGTDCCVLANNHLLDWGEAGLLETLDTLERAGLSVAGAGRNIGGASAPAVLEVAGKGRVLVFAVAAIDSGLPRSWAADTGRPGVHLLLDYSERSVDGLADQVEAIKRPGDIAVASIHWGGNWGYAIPREQRRFAHALIDRASIDIVHGHSSHHSKAIEVYHDRPILYGCGDLLNDYEGIPGYEQFRDDLVLMYFPAFDVRKGCLRRLEMTPLQVRNFRLQRPSPADREWLHATLDRECRRFGHRVALREEGFALDWGESPR